MDYTWQASLREAQSETDPKKLIEKLCEVEELIYTRSQEIANSKGEESAAMTAALQELLRIRSEKLGWPGVDSSGA
jgi:hypothetical protein